MTAYHLAGESSLAIAGEDGKGYYGAGQEWPFFTHRGAPPRLLGPEEDCSVAFLNPDHGKVTNLDGWHWVLLTGLRHTGGLVRLPVGGAL